MKRTQLVWGTIAAIIVIGGCSKTQGAKTQETRRHSSEQPAPRPTAVGTGGAASNIQSDDKFVHDIAIMNMAEVELSRIALAKAASGDIKAFAQRMIDDHGTAANELKSAVEGYSIEWPGELDDTQKKSANELAKKRGPDFDRDYAKSMVEGHQNLAARLESRLDVQSLAEWKTAAAGRAQTKALPDPKTEMADLKITPLQGGNEITRKINQWAADVYPVVQKHLDTARTLETAAKKRSTN